MSNRGIVIHNNVNQFVVYHRRELWAAHVVGGEVHAIIDDDETVLRIIEHLEERSSENSKKLAYVRAKETPHSKRPSRLNSSQNKAKKK